MAEPSSLLAKVPVGRIVVGFLIALSLAVTLAWGSWEYYAGGQSRVGPEQPIPFSHRLHASKEIDGGKDIECRFCHTGVYRK